MGLFMWSPDNPASTFGTGKDKKLGMEWERANIARKGQVQASGLSAAANITSERIKAKGALRAQGLKSGRSSSSGDSAMDRQTLIGEQAMELEHFRQRGARSAANMRQPATGGGMSGRKLIDVPTYDESGQFQIGTTPGVADMETGEYMELQKKKKKKKPISEMTLKELYEARKAFGR